MPYFDQLLLPPAVHLGDVENVLHHGGDELLLHTTARVIVGVGAGEGHVEHVRDGDGDGAARVLARVGLQQALNCLGSKCNIEN